MIPPRFPPQPPSSSHSPPTPPLAQAGKRGERSQPHPTSTHLPSLPSLAGLPRERAGGECDLVQDTTLTMTLWVDADACPKVIKEIIFRASKRRSVPVCLVANQPMYVPPDPLLRVVVVGKGLDVADDHIVDQIQPQDVVITADIPLAARVVAKGAVGINPRGELYTEDNVRARLSVRDFMQGLREAGVETGGPPPFHERDKRHFADALEKALNRKR